MMGAILIGWGFTISFMIAALGAIVILRIAMFLIGELT